MRIFVGMFGEKATIDGVCERFGLSRLLARKGLAKVLFFDRLGERIHR